ADRQLQAPGKGRRRNLGTDALCKDARSGIRSLVEDQRELFAAVTRADVRLAGAGQEDLRQLREHGIAIQVAVGVVDLLEVVEVDHQEGDRVVMAARPLHLLQKSLRQLAAV